MDRINESTGVETFGAQDDEDVQCARCGSSVGWVDDPTLDDPHAGYHACLSSEEWCQSHPLKGRDRVKGAGRP